jgi:hypothetical protein
MSHIISSLLDSVCEFRIHAIPSVDNSGSLLDDTERFDERGRQALGWTTNIKVLEGPVRKQVSTLADAQRYTVNPTSESEHPNSDQSEPEVHRRYRVQHGIFGNPAPES